MILCFFNINIIVVSVETAIFSLQETEQSDKYAAVLEIVGW